MPYRATLRQPSTQHAFSLIFRHPVRIDEVTGRKGKRVHQGLGTRDRAEAEALRVQMDALLADDQFHTASARKLAADRFDQRVVEIFYHQLASESLDFAAFRDQVIPLPSSDVDGYRRVLLLGTTGAGKTTLLRQLIGSDPSSDRFPSTSAAKTTIADTEIVFAEGPFHAVVTFAPRDEVRDHVEECVSAAILAAYRGERDVEVMRRLLSHGEQRYRFNYVLGNGPLADPPRSSDDETDDEDSDESAAVVPRTLEVELQRTNKVLNRALKVVQEIAGRRGEALRAELDASGEEDLRVVDELFEDQLDSLVREEEGFHEVVDELMEEIEERFSDLEPGTVAKTKQGWPIHWQWQSNDREGFLRVVKKFSGNQAPMFGSLLTPLVNGIRVRGAFRPRWSDGEMPKLVLIDGEGLGHVPTSTATLNAKVTKRVAEVDAVVLVDNAEQPMQAGSVAAIRTLVYTGSVRKLILAFTHFDGVRGDNLPNPSDREQHVVGSVENLIVSIGDEIGPQAERMLRSRVDESRYFLGGIDRLLDRRKSKRTIAQLHGLLAAIETVVDRVATGKARPVYDRMNLVLAIREAAQAFHESWLIMLGLKANPGRQKEHWTRVKALSRRLATGMADEYDTLRPVADLHISLQKNIRALLERPVEWSLGQPETAEAGQFMEDFATLISARIREVALRRVKAERNPDWVRAYAEQGYGSSFRRAELIAHDIYERAAPVPDVAPSVDRNRFLHEVVETFEAAAKEVVVRLI